MQRAITVFMGFRSAGFDFSRKTFNRITSLLRFGLLPHDSHDRLARGAARTPRAMLGH
jgi:hypothetical protein